MLKRLVGVITVKDGWAVQSIGYERYLPLGRAEVIAENYDRWQLDEILLVNIDRSSANAGPDFGLLDRVAGLNLTTPLCYSGGIRSADDAVALVKGGADRVAMESLFHDDPKACLEIRDAIGRQAVIRAQTVHAEEDGTVAAYDYRRRRTGPALNDLDIDPRRNGFSELLLIDWKNEGRRNSFDERLAEFFYDKPFQLICFGGVSEKSQVQNLFNMDHVSAVAIGNFLSYRELPHRAILSVSDVDRAREVSYGEQTKGALQW